MIPKDANRRRIYLMRHGSVTYFDKEGRPHQPDSVPLLRAMKRMLETARRHSGQCASSGNGQSRTTASGFGMALCAENEEE